MWIARVSLASLALLAASLSHAQLVLTEGTNLAVDGHPTAGITFDLLGGIWALDDGATTARNLLGTQAGARQPRWSPDGQHIVFARPATADLAILEIESGQVTRLATGRNARWHPDGERVLYVDRGRGGLSQLFEIDVSTGLNWQLTHAEESVTAGAWSADGQQLTYITRNAERYRLRLRNLRGDRVLVDSAARLSSPSIRPDNSLVTFVRHGAELTMEMVILSEPILVRSLIREPDLFDAPVVWRTRQQMLYAANGDIRRRHFDSWIPRTVPFRASIDLARQEAPTYTLPANNRSGEAWVLRVKQLFDGRRSNFRASADIVIQGDTIVAIEGQKDRGKLQVINMGQATAIPGLIDACARPPTDESDARALLAHGVLTLVPDQGAALETDFEFAPRILAPGCADAVARKRYAKQQLARVSPAGLEYQDSRLDASGEAQVLLSGLARPPINDPPDPFSDFLFTESPIAGQLALASANNQWPLPLAALAELKALSGGSRNHFDALLAATGTAANYLGLDGQIGVLEPGAIADIVLLAGNPGEDLAVMRKPIAIVLHGRLIGRSALLTP